MATYYSRKAVVEEKRNVKSAVLFGFLAVVVIVGAIFWGIPALSRVIGLALDLKKTSQPIKTNDTTPPPPPKFTDLPKATNQQQINITGSTEPGATVQLFVNGQKQEIVAGSDGKFQYNATLQSGDNTIYGVAKDSSGNQSQQSETLSVSYDTQPPNLAISKPNDGDQFYGSKQRQLVIEGKADAGDSININGRLVIVSDDGSFTYATTLSEGQNQFDVKAQDAAGNSTEKTFSVTFTP